MGDAPRHAETQRHSSESWNLFALGRVRKGDSSFRWNDGGANARRGFSRSRCSAQQGFTLIELMVVIVIIGLLTTIVVINVMPSQDKAMVQKAKTDVALLEQAVERYRLDNLSYPSTADGLQALVSRPQRLAQPERYQRGGYIKRLPEDPWGQAYQYVSPGRHGPFDIYSLGADGREGGEDEDADIGNWG